MSLGHTASATADRNVPHWVDHRLNLLTAFPVGRRGPQKSRFPRGSSKLHAQTRWISAYEFAAGDAFLALRLDRQEFQNTVAGGDEQ